MAIRKCVVLVIGCYVSSLFAANAQSKSLVNTSQSKYAKLSGVDMGSVQWTKGFWAERMQVCKDSMVPHLWHTYTSDISHAYKNFQIAAGLDTGKHDGPTFHDGDFYKTIEAVASLYANTKDNKLDLMMDSVIATLVKVQREDGYIYTVEQIAEKNTGIKKRVDAGLSFEAYNFGHLMTAACVHYRVTGKTSLLDIAKKATDYLYEFYMHASPDQARNAICPSHYMGVVEMYRTTKNDKYLAFAKRLIEMKGKNNDGTDDNQDRIPFRQQRKAMGHAVRANYLYAGVADVYAETGDTSLLNTLDLIWDDLVTTKTYVTGGCGALYDGVSPDGTSYQPTYIQKTHQAFGRDYQLPNITAYNETCANIGNMLWNWRMLQITGAAKYADVMEQDLYNSILSGISLDGTEYFYTNPLAQSDAFPYTMRWDGGRIPYIRLSNCCPPNVIRTIAEVSNYAYSISNEGVYVNLYGANTIATTLKDGSAINISQETNYPWDGNISIKIGEATAKKFSIFLRIPGWSKNAKLLVNGKAVNVKLLSGEYAEVNRQWKAGDVISLQLPMPAVMLEANPLVEESRNQIAVRRGPVVYCLESSDYAKGDNIFDIVMSATANLKPVATKINNSNITALKGTAILKTDTGWDKKLYKEVSANSGKPVTITLIPYYSWGNRGKSEMSVWMPYR
jgi:DUF1680 family protein